eukprot:CAMPEP_0114322336 /NCGR_PEP_ID=MMETSP0059-20121206/27168_1 /TAXON_ID=36894 /ORGANISM="Pyramimonas parkeae, Strain CCMP726" /LENGTH=45 /DNA_ID= /DNA_START= /DNA_END= /DNA_ORIENTATION=
MTEVDGLPLTADPRALNPEFATDSCRGDPSKGIERDTFHPSAGAK